MHLLCILHPKLSLLNWSWEAQLITYLYRRNKLCHAQRSTCWRERLGSVCPHAAETTSMCSPGTALRGGFSSVQPCAEERPRALLCQLLLQAQCGCQFGEIPGSYFLPDPVYWVLIFFVDPFFFFFLFFFFFKRLGFFKLCTNF